MIATTEQAKLTHIGGFVWPKEKPTITGFRKGVHEVRSNGNKIPLPAPLTFSI